MRVLVTRAGAEGEATAQRVVALGHETFFSPVLEIEALPFPPIDLGGVQALLFASGSGVKTFGLQNQLPVFAVGDATAQAARTIGYSDVRSADGNAADLVAFAQTLDPKAGALQIICGENVAVDIATALAAKGFDARRQVVYRAKFADALTPAGMELLTNPSQDDSVLFHSARGVEALIALARGAGVDKAALRLRAFCMSARIAEMASSLDFSSVYVADAPKESALLALLGSLSSERA